MENSVIEQLCNSLETIVKSRIKIEEERHYSNHREVWRLINLEYDPAIVDFKKYLRETIREVIREEISNQLNIEPVEQCEWEVTSSHLDQVDYRCKTCGYEETVTTFDVPRCSKPSD